MNIRRVVIAVDLTPASVLMAQWVLKTFGPELEPVFVHAIEAHPGDGSPRISAAIETECLGAEERIRDLAESLGVEQKRWVVRVGEPADVISDAATTWGVQLVVLGSHQGGRTWGAADTVEKIMERVSLPVLIVQATRDSRPTHVLVALERVSDLPRHFAAWMGFLHHRLQGRFHVLHGVTPSLPVEALGPIQIGSRDPPETHPAVALPEAFRGTLSALGIPEDAVTVESRWGAPGEEIVAAAEVANCDLILIGRSRHGRLERALFGSVTRHVAHSAACPVLVIPQELPESELVTA